MDCVYITICISPNNLKQPVIEHVWNSLEDKGSHQLILMHIAPTTWRFSKCPLEVAVVHRLDARARPPPPQLLRQMWLRGCDWLCVLFKWKQLAHPNCCVLCTFPHFSETSMLMSTDSTTYLFLSESTQPSPVPTDVSLLCNSLTAPRPRSHALRCEGSCH